MVAFFVDGTRITHGLCGVSRLMQVGVTNSLYVYQVLNTECAIGDRTFTHELGHILAGRHDIGSTLLAEENAGTNPFTTDVGFTDFVDDFRTIMGDNSTYVSPCDTDNGCSRINRWSSANQTWMGNPLGSSGHHIGNSWYWLGNHPHPRHGTEL